MKAQSQAGVEFVTLSAQSADRAQKQATADKLKSNMFRGRDPKKNLLQVLRG
jgi:hypothetical protein